MELGLTFYILGSYCGLIVDAKYFNGTHKNINHTKVKKTLLRLLVTILIVLPCYVAPIVFISDENNVFIVFFFKYSLPSFAISFILFGFSKRVFEKWNLVSLTDPGTDPALLAINDKETSDSSLNTF